MPKSKTMILKKKKSTRRTSPQSSSDSELQATINRLQEKVKQLEQQTAPRFDTAMEPDEHKAKEIPDHVLSARQQHADQLEVPGRNAPRFNLVSDYLKFCATPWADPLVPAYLLDNNYRIVDWNSAFNAAFDQTMEGRRGQSVLEWVYFLDNFQEVLDRAVKAFADPNNLPAVHVEPIQYTSPRYGKITAIKRAYLVPQESKEILGWLVTLDVKFDNPEMGIQFRRDLFKQLRRDLTWSEYSLSYDRVLLPTIAYSDLLDHILGEKVPGGTGNLKRIPDRSRILDLGAGSGNVSRRLAEQQRGHVIFAFENNRAMLDLLREKCRPFLRDNDEASGVLAIKQDVNTLFGLAEDSFDVALLNNVAYTLDDPVLCFRQVRNALKPGGEIRVSGPQKKTRLERLFARIESDLKRAGKFEELAADFNEVFQVNQMILRPSLFRWTVQEMRQLLSEAGFKEFVYSTDTAYAGEAMLVAARKT